MPDRLSWAEIRRLALQHRKALVLANLIAVLATLCSVPIPLLLPLLVDEVLLGDGNTALQIMDRVLPTGWQTALGYIGLMLCLTLLLRGCSLLFNVLQARLFAQLSKDVVYRIRVRLIERLKRIALGEYESLGGGTVAAHLVTDLETIDKFIGETLSRLLVAVLSIFGTAAILLWMHWQLALLILLFNPLVIYATVQLGKRVKHLKKLENDSTARFTQALTETLDAIQEVRAGNRQQRHQQAAQGFTDEFVDGLQVGDQMRGHRAAAKAFVFGQRNTLEAFDQADADAVDDVLRQAREQARLQYVEYQRGTTQEQGQAEHQADVTRRGLPTLRKEVIHDLQCGVAVTEQHLIDQQRQQQGDRYAAQGRQHGDQVGQNQRLAMMQRKTADLCPAEPVSHGRCAPASESAAAATRPAADNRWSAAPTGHRARRAGSENRRCRDCVPRQSRRR